MLAGIFITQDKKDKKGIKEIYYIVKIQLSNYASHARGLSIKCEKCDLFTTPLSLRRYKNAEVY